MNYYVNFLGRLGSNGFQLKKFKKSKSWGPFWSYRLNSTANSAHLRVKWAELALLSSWSLQNGPQDFDFFNCTMVADYSFDMKNIDVWAPTFFKHNNSFIATVSFRLKSLTNGRWRLLKIIKAFIGLLILSFCRILPLLF